MAHSKPVIAAAHGGLLDIFADGQSGILFTPCSEADLGLALRRLISDTPLRLKLGAKGHERLRAHFSLQAQARDFLSLYKSVQVESK
jgi:glycosyltransferase involved in cell wall biosynthesis